eukprot:TRINITY_DN3864_c0_g1_i1.p1 TRINITY_DN3864_c0_g1~~TRINITY_DN3864_c0_g1_i1.p1  ORF type:complete len:348 (-),score=147.51 TRINITY_DN3864_c0_g1_i1:73-1062(-)
MLTAVVLFALCASTSALWHKNHGTSDSDSSTSSSTPSDVKALKKAQKIADKIHWHHSDRDILQDRAVPPPLCNQAYAVDMYESALLYAFSSQLTGVPTPKMMLNELLADSNVEFFLNSHEIWAPVLAAKSEWMDGVRVAPRLVERSAAAGNILTLRWQLRIGTEQVSAADVDVVTEFALNGTCTSKSARVFFVAEQLPEALHPLFAPQAAVACPPGERRVTDDAECTPYSCRSPRACPADACHRAPVDADTGIEFTCGCPTGYEVNGHTLQCEAVTCEAASACPPTATCEPLPADTINNCNPTPSLPEQWVRGSKPCPQFRCVPRQPQP